MNPGFAAPRWNGAPDPPRVAGTAPGPRERAWLAAYPDRRRLLAARRRRLERALFLEGERSLAWARLRIASVASAAAGVLLVGAGLPFRAGLAFLGGALLFVLGGLGLAVERVGRAARAERRRKLAERLARLVRKGNEMDARARRLAAALGVNPWEGPPPAAAPPGRAPISAGGPR